MGWLQKLKNGLTKTSSSIMGKLGTLFEQKKLDEYSLEQLEEILLQTDMGVAATKIILDDFKKQKFSKNSDIGGVKESLIKSIADILSPLAKTLEIPSRAPQDPPHVIMVCGVNGGGKTTTIGKLAHNFQNQGHKVLLAACDTFRAAALEQLKIWADRAHCPLVHGNPQSDPASVAYIAMQKAQEDKADILFLDTAGRLPNKTDLMNELGKCKRVVQKIDPNAPHDVILVLDGTTGQNAYSQVELFKECVNINGLIITKLDSTAKGGIVVGLAQKYQIPIYAIGVGEGLEDLLPFIPEEFARAMIEEG